MVHLPVAKLSKARACGRSLAGVAGSNPAGGMGICVVCCGVWIKGKSLEPPSVQILVVVARRKDRERKIKKVG